MMVDKAITAAGGFFKDLSENKIIIVGLFGLLVLPWAVLFFYEQKDIEREDARFISLAESIAAFENSRADTADYVVEFWERNIADINNRLDLIQAQTVAAEDGNAAKLENQARTLEDLRAEVARLRGTQ